MSALPDSNISVTYASPGATPRLSYTPLSTPSPNQLLIKVKAAAINPCDIQMWRSTIVGWGRLGREGTMGWDYAGTIAAVGKKLKGKWEVGDEVWGIVDGPSAKGSFTKYLTVSGTSAIAKKPKGWSWADAAATPLVTLTAFKCLDSLPPPKPSGERRIVVIAGASGGTGMWCVSLAKQVYDCHVIAICSGRNADFVKELGANEVIDYTKSNIAQALLAHELKGKFDLYIDCVGGTELFGQWRNIINKKGAYITIVGDKTSRTITGPPLTYFTHPRQIIRHAYGMISGPKYAAVILYNEAKYLEQVAKLAEEGKVKVVVQEVIEGLMDDGKHEKAWARAYGLMEEGRVRGKVVLKIDDSTT